MSVFLFCSFCPLLFYCRVESCFVQPNIKLLAIDLDGTTVNHDINITSRVLAAVQAATVQGVRVVIATGRNTPSTRAFAERFGVLGPTICQQGGMIYDFASETALHKITLDHTLACDLLALEQKHPTWKPVLYQHDDIYVSDGDFFARLDGLVGFDPHVAPDLCGMLAGTDADKVLFTMNPADVPDALRIVRELVGERANVVQSHAMFVEINPLGADKGTALAWLAGYLNVPRENVMAIGDQGNDETMVAWAGLGVAMGNGNDATKTVADWIAPTIDDDGAAVAIERFILNS